MQTPEIQFEMEQTPNERVLRARQPVVMLDEDLDLLNALRNENIDFTDCDEEYPSDNDDYMPMIQPETSIDDITREKQYSQFSK